MKIVRFRGFDLIFLFALAVISHAEWNLHTPCAVSEENSLFVNSTSGQNIPSCGLKENPACLTISHAIKMAVQRNFSSVLINISTGSYNELDSIKLDCSRWNLKKIVLWGERQDKQVVQVGLSLDIQFCEMSLINIHWTSGHSVLHNVLLSNLSICECTVQRTDFSAIGSSSNIVLQDSSISSSSGYQQELPLISVSSLPGHQNMLYIMNCNFSHNMGPLIFVSSIYQASIINSHMESNRAFFGDLKMITSQFSHLSIFTTRFVDNFGTLVEVQNSGSLNASDCHFNQNQVFAGSILQLQGMTRAGFKDCVFQDSSSSSEGPVIRIIDNYSSASFERCHFSCNMVNGSVFVPPVFSHDVHQMSCYNCSVDHNCPVHCSPGQFVSSGIFCKSCPVGSYSPGVTGNKTVMQCASCPPGTYGSKTKSVNCTPCAKDTFSSKAGSTSCTKCKNDFFTSRPGQATCSRLTVEFITLVVVTSLLIFIPLLILLLQSKRSAHKGDAYFLVRSDDASPLLRKNNNSNHSIQNNDAEDSSLSDLLS